MSHQNAIQKNLKPFISIKNTTIIQIKLKDE